MRPWHSWLAAPMAALAITAGSTPPAPARPCAVLDALMAADNANDR